MSLLRDEELIAAITAQPPATRYVEGVVLPVDPADRYSKDSPVQASSIDLHIGNVYLPGRRNPILAVPRIPETIIPSKPVKPQSSQLPRDFIYQATSPPLDFPPPGFLSKAY